ncbi:MAG TPA: hypothetical protein VIE65_19415 [Methylobacter sp.]|jgi:outer membrane lipoprotein SlyB
MTQKSTNDILPLLGAIGSAIAGAAEIGSAVAGGVARTAASAAGGIASSVATQRKEDDDSGTSDARYSTALTHDQIKAGRSACVK